MDYVEQNYIMMNRHQWKSAVLVTKVTRSPAYPA